MKLGKGLIIGGAFWILFDLFGGSSLFIHSLPASSDVRFWYHIIMLVLSLGMIVWGIRRVKSARKRASVKEVT